MRHGNGSVPRVAVVTDTTAYLPSRLVEENGIQLVSLYVNWADGSERESEMANFDAFYERLRTSEQLPTTSQPSIGDFLAVYEPLVEQGRDVVSIHISGGISGTVEAARQAAAELDASGRRIEVVDSRLACGALGMVVLSASAVARAGADIDAVTARTREAAAATRLWFAVDTLEYLQRGGRIGPAQAWLGGALKIKPILTFDGEISPVERVRTSGRAFERMVHYLRSRHEDGADGWVIQHIQAPDVAERLVASGREIFGREPLFVSEIGPVIGAHTGPGLVGVGGIPLALLDAS
jgi:DegV family protein with EDD domain